MMKISIKKMKNSFNDDRYLVHLKLKKVHAIKYQ